MVSFTFTRFALKRFHKLPPRAQRRIEAKLCFLKDHPDIFTMLRPLHDFAPATHRLRIGAYRLILALETGDNTEVGFLILDVGHRREIYGK